MSKRLFVGARVSTQTANALAACAEHCLAQVPAERSRAHLEVDQEERRLARAELPQDARRAAQRLAERGLAELAALADAHQQHALGGDARQVAQQQRGAGFARQVAQRSLERALRHLVDAPRRRAQLAVLVDAEHDAAFRRLGCKRLYAKFHSESIA